MVAIASPWVSGQDKAKDKSDKEPAAKARGMLPANYGKLSLDEQQKQRIYHLQGEYQAKIDALLKQVRELRDQERKDVEEVLTPAQKERLRELLADVGLESFAKTSGSLGLHVHVPLGTPQDAAATKAFARLVARILAAERPDEVVAEMRKSDRPGKVYVDWLQNDATRQTVAPYSLRGLPLPTVATPVTWEEVEQSVGEDDPGVLTFLPDDVLARVEHLGDLFAPVRGLRQQLPKPANV